MQEQIRFTPTEWEIIAHRLGGAPDAIAEALTDYCEGEEPAVRDTPEEVEACANELYIFGPNMLIASSLQYAVLLDALDGSTFFQPEMPERKKYEQAAASIERKFFRHFGERVRIPRA